MLRRLPHRASSLASDVLVRRCRRPLLWTLALGLGLLGERGLLLTPGPNGVVRHTLVVALIASSAWLLYRVATLGIDVGLARYAVGPRDAARIRRVRTQADLLRRITGALSAVLAGAAILMTFHAVRTFGASVFASAGLLGLVAGVAAQSTLANLFAGMQLAFGDMVRIGDEVVVAGEWGTVEEITLTYVVIATWDQRRIVMPVSYFAGKPFENWSRSDPAITGTAMFHLDYSAPIPELRDRFSAVLRSTRLWNGKGEALQVVDTTPTTLVVRALMTADNASDAFELRCLVREELVAYLRQEHGYALPRISVGSADGSFPGSRAPGKPLRQQGRRGGADG
ncbi:mechanosensitive ion channel family protein [Streptacidiphilus pinicola]|uniref:Mechanosensitive ion channel family protein n=1 Tax=Streptacidiphilus pinicola TaxID=2219663 RepID=A0A2X0IUH6_9ACTN|nr:mechanosensitive ion channel family protein [Streptacidiphilus pinicola]